MYKMDEWEAGQGGEYLADGRGAHVLCQRCNNETGGAYGGAFVDWARQGMERVHRVAGKRSMNFHGVIYPLRVLKQIATIFFDTAVQGSSPKTRELARFVLDRESTALPPDYRFFAFWYGGGELRQTGVMAALNLAGSGMTVLAEFVHPPFGYVLLMSGGFYDRQPQEITDFSKFRYDEAITLNRRFPVLETHWMMAGDYRTREQIERDAIINDLEGAGIRNARDLLEQFERAGG